jgi:hypothetical protein
MILALGGYAPFCSPLLEEQALYSLEDKWAKTGLCLYVVLNLSPGGQLHPREPLSPLGSNFTPLGQVNKNRQVLYSRLSKAL